MTTPVPQKPKMNYFSMAIKGAALVGDLVEIAFAFIAQQRPDYSDFSDKLFTILTVDFKVKPGQATPAKIANALNSITDLFLA